MCAILAIVRETLASHTALPKCWIWHKTDPESRTEVCIAEVIQVTPPRS